MQIFVKLLTGKVVTITVSLTDTILKVKQQVADQHKIPIPEQRLIYSGTALEDAKTLGDYDIPQEGTLYLIESAQSEVLQLHVKTSNMTTLILEVPKTCTTEALKEKIAEKNGIAPSEQLLYTGQRVLPAGLTLSAAGVSTGAEITVVTALEGGSFT